MSKKRPESIKPITPDKRRSKHQEDSLMQAKPTSKPRSVEQIESEIIAFYQESLQTGNNVHDAVALTAIKFEMHWATIKMVVGA